MLTASNPVRHPHLQQRRQMASNQPNRSIVKTSASLGPYSTSAFPVAPSSPQLDSSSSQRKRLPLSFDPSAIVFDEATIAMYEKLLKASAITPPSGINPHHIRYKFPSNVPQREAAVLVPLCTVNGQACILLTVRGAHLRTHSNEVSFPGGARDKADPTLEFAALRETHEEIGIAPSQVRILGRSTPAPNRTHSTIVTPFVGFVTTDLASVDDLCFNKDEVAQVLSVPIRDLLDPTKRDVENFRGAGISISSWPLEGTPHRIWGLTAYILDEFLNKIVIKHHSHAPQE
ncbi:hypothetical protein BASA50_004791 [Batrachochytrium salamandrivorans]|uniref:Nudix hydrolase domain-containing protein n=1 Tax=Batrachochytrium salamandrivorans TaxID=1357716 RepID=A0ABQ8FER7_9FUNG|nr:hypothetical protein BASA60_007899 [Batrachochytrium salamandrivorans]KAH6571671.1 hypothetical protein BASA62_003757 [Batrachochytrium salamandrivorans]KAH6597033.1 hypothetical protein BASA50_004791 [Batrachochytrium salamandrivorans]KAH9273420.1 hypothetical protein BASA83_004084 [Batrachochytrium salamandrivorans]